MNGHHFVTIVDVSHQARRLGIRRNARESPCTGCPQLRVIRRVFQQTFQQIDGTPIKDVKEFEKLLKKEGELRLSVNRMTKGRQVKINMSVPASKPSGSAPATRAAEEE